MQPELQPFEAEILSESPRARRWIAPLLAAVTVALLPWTFWLTETLPSRNVTEHWDTVWTGFDLALLVALGSTAYAVYRRTAWLQGAAAAAGAMLVCDAWFDTLLTQGHAKNLFVIVQAFASELPLAFLCFWIARDSARFWGRWQAVIERVPPRATRAEAVAVAQAPGRG